MAKFALISEGLPPSTASPGQAGMLYRLLAPLDPAEYCLISRIDFNSEEYRDAANRLSASYYSLDGNASGGSALALPSRVTKLLLRAKEIAAIARREGCRAIVTCPDRVGDLPTAYLASRLVGAEFFPYLFDHYSAWFNSGPSGLVARRLEPFLLKRAAGVFVPNEGLRDALAELYGIEATVIHNSCDLSAYHGPAADRNALEPQEVRVVFTGMINAAHYDGFRALLAALDGFSGRARLHVYSPMPRSVLAERGLDRGVVFHGYVGSTEMPSVQQEADVLFLPLAFHSPFPEVIRTSAPAKMAEYLAAARPILVHAPANSFVAQYVRRHECGLVVTEEDPAALQKGLVAICDDPALQERLAANAWRRAREDFDLAKARAVFADRLGVRVGAS